MGIKRNGKTASVHSEAGGLPVGLTCLQKPYMSMAIGLDAVDAVAVYTVYAYR